MTAVLVSQETGANLYGLRPWEEAFAKEYHAGEQAGNGTRSLMKVRPDYGYDRASVEASLLLKDRRVASFLEHLREDALKKFRKGIIALVPKALAVVEEALNSESWSLRKWATEVVLDRGLGKPIQPVELDPSFRMDQLLKDLSEKRRREGRHPHQKPEGFTRSLERQTGVIMTGAHGVEVGREGGEEHEGT